MIKKKINKILTIVFINIKSFKKLNFLTNYFLHKTNKIGINKRLLT